MTLHTIPNGPVVSTKLIRHDGENFNHLVNTFVSILNSYARAQVLNDTKDIEDIDPLNITWATNFLATYCNGHPFKEYAPEDKSTISYIPWVDTSKTKDFSYAFAEYPNLLEIPEIDTSSAVTTEYMFLPLYHYADIDDAYYKFKTIPKMDLSNVENTTGMFYNLFYLEELPDFNTPKLKIMDAMFRRNYKLKALPKLDTSNVESCDFGFAGCEIIKDYNGNTEWPKCKVWTSANNFYLTGNVELNLPEAETFYLLCWIFGGLTGSPFTLKVYIPKVKDLEILGEHLTEWPVTSSLENVERLCLRGLQISEIPDLYLPNLTTAERCFGETKYIVKIGKLYTPKLRNITQMLYYMSSDTIRRIEEIDFSCAENSFPDIPSQTNLYDMSQATELYYCVIKNLGKSERTDYHFQHWYKWGLGGDTEEEQAEGFLSVIDTLITYSYDRAANNMPPITIHLGTNLKKKLSAELLATIAAKGFTIV